ncbi:hypothetical protein SLEP1_g59949 [Rubroshorea leprosula]|uniref:TF-B3 domain-containing protein n=1 Tax=Rubroshorea leprosula TaxID=152421 RepID=A0AAV5MUZ1_9ROSI|nr:hypothetical protein SLEP1_g59949 [Rubroshorea leprosula]
MAILIFSKYLSKTDIGKRLSVPSKSLKHLPAFKEGRHTVDFKVRDENGHAWTFRCSTRTKKKHLKPVLTKGWREFVCKRRLISGDKVELHRDEEKDCITYRVRVGRPTKFLQSQPVENCYSLADLNGMTKTGPMAKAPSCDSFQS